MAAAAGRARRDEEPLRAAYREIAEETGIEKADLEFVKACPELLVYELPPEARSKKTGRGQVLYWFLFHFRGNPRAGTPTRESRGSRWMPFRRVIDGVTSFRKPMYAASRAGVRRLSRIAKGLNSYFFNVSFCTRQLVSSPT